MTQPPARPKVYHITHVANLPSIVAEGSLLSDAVMLARGGPARVIGMSEIKRRRIEELEVTCHPGTKVGDYVPFYFCPRSVMLYVISRANHPDLAYTGGQGPIVHLEADLQTVVEWVESNDGRWAFSLSNAGARYTEFRSRIEDLDALDWNSIGAADFRSSEVKERKQAEFLMLPRFPFELVERIGVASMAVRHTAAAALSAVPNAPPIALIPGWYF